MRFHGNNQGAGYDIGDVALVTAKFTHGITGAGVDPSTLKYTFIEPDGAVVEYTYPDDTEITRTLDEDGKPMYHCQHALSKAGWYGYVVTATGDGASVEKGKLYVRG